MTENQQEAALQAMTAAMEAAAWHGTALNPVFPVKDRLACALKALEHYETVTTHYESEVALLEGRARVNQERAEAAETALAAVRAEVESFSMMSARYSIIAEQIVAWEEVGDD